MSILAVTLLLSVSPLTAVNAEPSRHESKPVVAASSRAGKAVFDIRTSDPRQLLFILKLVEETAAGLRQTGQGVDFVLSFRGGTLPLLTSAPDTADAAEKAILREVRERLADYRRQGLALEACTVAAGLFKISAEQLDPNLQLVGNSLVSLIRYQNRGYALVPMY